MYGALQSIYGPSDDALLISCGTVYYYSARKSSIQYASQSNIVLRI